MPRYLAQVTFYGGCAELFSLFIFVAVFVTAVETLLILYNCFGLATRASEQLGVARCGGVAGERIRAVRRGDGRFRNLKFGKTMRLIALSLLEFYICLEKRVVVIYAKNDADTTTSATFS